MVHLLSSQTKPMKIQSKLTAVFSIAAMVTGPFATAEDAAPVVPEIVVCEIAPEIAICEKAPEIAVCPEIFILPETTEICILPPPEEPLPVDKDKVVDPGDPSTENEVTVAVEEDPVVVGGENGVPIEWVKRGGGGEDPSLMYMTGAPMAGGPAPLLEKGATSRELGQDDKAAAIETKANTAAPAILSENNEPVALIKKGRVFLR
jgi:hypothetical protein